MIVFAWILKASRWHRPVNCVDGVGNFTDIHKCVFGVFVHWLFGPYCSLRQAHTRWVTDSNLMSAGPYTS